MMRRFLLIPALILAATLPAHAQEEGDEEPPPAQANPHGKGPPAGHGGGGNENMFQAPEDASADDPSLPAGSIAVQILDPLGKPIPRATVTFGILFNSIAKGDSRKRLTVEADASGVARLENQETGSGVAYRPMVLVDGATFSMMPFRLSEKVGMRAKLHVYPVVEDMEKALVVSQSILYAEVKDDRIQVQQLFKIYNFGKTAWLPKDLVVGLPETFTAFTTQQGMSDVGVDAVPKQGARLHGTFTPGQHSVELRWQLPYSGEAEIRFDVGMPPHTAAARVIAPASREMQLEVVGFPPPQATNDQQGQRALITEKQMRREDPPLKTVSVVIKGLPTEGPAKFIASALSAAAVVAGLVLGAKKPAKRDRKRERARLLEELESLEAAHKAGDIGPKTYQQARQDLLEALSRTFVETPKTSKKS